MSNLAAILRQEIQRLSRRESRSQMAATKKASTQHRRHIAALKRQVETLERQVAQLRRRAASGKADTASATETTEPKIRFVPKGLKSHRERLGLSAADFGRLVGVSAQSVYNWEQGHSNPRPQQLKAIAGLRSAGKRAVQALLSDAAAPAAKRPAARRAKPPAPA
jgi:DNA-binding transcriptional regulator YiaG